MNKTELVTVITSKSKNTIIFLKAVMQPHRLVSDYHHHVTSFIDEELLKNSMPPSIVLDAHKFRSQSLTPPHNRTSSEEETSPERDENSNVNKNIEKEFKFFNGISDEEKVALLNRQTSSGPRTPPARPVPQSAALHSSGANLSSPTSTTTNCLTSATTTLVPGNTPVSVNNMCGQMNNMTEIRRYRTAFSREQIARLEKEFHRENYVSRPRRCELAQELGLPEATIKVWFQNRRMKDKRQRQAYAFPYADPAFAAYIFHAAAAGACPPYIPPSALTSHLGAHPVLPYAAPNPHLARFSPYPLPSIRSHPTSLLANHYPRSGTLNATADSSYSFLNNHLSSCPSRDSGKVGCEGCLCSILYPGLIAMSPFQHSSIAPSLSSQFPSSAFTTSSANLPKATPETPTTPYSRPSTVSPTNGSPPLKPSLFQPYKDDVL